MHWSKLKNTYNRNRTDDNWNNYKQQRNKFVTILRRTKLYYYKHLDAHDLTDNKRSGKQSNLFLQIEYKPVNPSIFLKRRNYKDDVTIAEVFNEYFANIIDARTNRKKSNHSFPVTTEDPNDKAVQKYKNHPSIKEIKHQFSSQDRFEFKKIKA